MKHTFNYILSFIIISVLITSCDAVKRVPESDYLLTKNSVHVNGKKDNTETINNLLYQKPNSKILNYPLRLNIYNLARPNIDSIVNANLDKKPHKRAHLESFLSKKQLDKYIDSRISFNDWLKKTGEAPVILNEDRTKKSIKRLNDYYINNGWFDVDSDYEIHKKDNQRAEVDYFVKTGEPFIIDSISKKYEPSVVDSIYRLIQRNSFIKQNEQYKTVNLQLERDRIASELRNKGVYHFSQDYIAFEVDTVGTNKKVKLTAVEKDRMIVLILSFIIVIVFWGAYEQAGGLMNLYARDKIDRVMFGFTVPTSFLQALHAFYVILFGVPVAYFWTRWRKKGKESSSLFKMGIGTIITGLGFLLLAQAAIETTVSLDGKASIYWMFGAYLLHVIGELSI